MTYKNYYNHPNRNLPDIIQCHVDSIIVYLAATLFTKEFIQDPQKAYNRILISDVNAGSNVSIGDAIEFMNSMHDLYPFVVYNVGDSVPSQWGNIAPVALIEQIFIPELNAYMRAFPMEIELDFVAFFNDSLDYRRAYTILGGEDAVPPRLYTPALFDDKEVFLPIDLKYEFNGSNLSKEFEQKILGRIWDLVFKITFRYYEYIIDELPLVGNVNVKDLTGIFPEQKRIAPVENILFRLFSQYKKEYKPITIEESFSPKELKVVKTMPKNEDENVNVNSIIQIEFNKPIRPNSFETNLEISPYLYDKNIYYNINYTIANIENLAPGGFLPNTVYEIKIKKDLLDENGVCLGNDFVFSFKTENTN